MKVALVALLVFLINVPFGALRSKHEKFSLMWWTYIHIPVPIVILLRIYSDIGFALYTYPILVGAFFNGQLVGRKYFAMKRKPGVVEVDEGHAGRAADPPDFSEQ